MAGALQGVRAPPAQRDRHRVRAAGRRHDARGHRLPCPGRELYGLGDGGGIYTLDTSTAEAKVTELTVDLQGDFLGVDFNPAANALRIISDTGQNLRHPFAGPLQFQTQTDTPLNYTRAPTRLASPAPPTRTMTSLPARTPLCSTSTRCSTRYPSSRRPTTARSRRPAR